MWQASPIVRKQGDTYPPIMLGEWHGAALVPYDLTDIDVSYRIAYRDRVTQSRRAKIIDAKRGVIAWPRVRLGRSTLELQLTHNNGDIEVIEQRVEVLRAL